MQKIVILIGISGSGKTTYTHINYPYHVHISPDNIRKELTGDISDQSRNKDVFELADQRFWEALSAGNHVVWDATNVDGKIIRTIQKKLNEWGPTTRDLQVVAFLPDSHASKERIAQDLIEGKDRSNVPSEAIDRQLQKLVNCWEGIKGTGVPIKCIQSCPPALRTIEYGFCPMSIQEFDLVIDKYRREFKALDASEKVSYSAVVLSEPSRRVLSSILKSYAPEAHMIGWEIIAHHMTICLGKLPDHCKSDMHSGRQIPLKVTHIGQIPNLVVAVKVEGYYSTNKVPHVTLAVNRLLAAKPVMSNSITDWVELPVPIEIVGMVYEVPN